MLFERAGRRDHECFHVYSRICFRAADTAALLEQAVGARFAPEVIDALTGAIDDICGSLLTCGSGLALDEQESQRGELRAAAPEGT